MQMIAALLGGGVLAKGFEWLSTRTNAVANIQRAKAEAEAARDKARAEAESADRQDRIAVRQEMWKEMGALREICEQQEKKIELLQKQVEHYQAEIVENRIAKHKMANLANAYRLELQQMMSDVNDRDRELGRRATYDMAAESLRLNSAEDNAQRHAIDEVVAGHQAAAKMMAEPNLPLRVQT